MAKKKKKLARKKKLSRQRTTVRFKKTVKRKVARKNRLIRKPVRRKKILRTRKVKRKFFKKPSRKKVIRRKVPKRAKPKSRKRSVALKKSWQKRKRKEAKIPRGFKTVSPVIVESFPEIRQEMTRALRIDGQHIFNILDPTGTIFETSKYVYSFSGKDEGREAIMDFQREISSELNKYDKAKYWRIQPNLKLFTKTIQEIRPGVFMYNIKLNQELFNRWQSGVK